jgi:hypothetical protein
MIPKDSLNITIMKDAWKRQWKGQWESMLSLESGLHFGHYIAGCNSNHIAYFYALKSTLVIKRGIVLDQWSHGLSVMLEKLLGCALTTKLRSILLMEADFYSTHKIMYGQRMLQVVRNYRLMLEEIYSAKKWLAKDRTFIKVLFYNIVQQSRMPVGISAFNADNCYNQITHPIASLLFLSLGVPKEACFSIFRTVHDLNFFSSHGIWGFKRFHQCNYRIGQGLRTTRV